MNKEEHSLLDHLTEIRGQSLPEGGVSTVIYTGKIRSEADLQDALGVHRKVTWPYYFKKLSNVSKFR